MFPFAAVYGGLAAASAVKGLLSKKSKPQDFYNDPIVGGTQFPGQVSMVNEALGKKTYDYLMRDPGFTEDEIR